MDKILQYFINTNEILWVNVASFLQISLAYFIIVILLPSFCLNKIVKKKNFIFRVFFYQTVANIYISIIGFLLSYLHIFNIYSLFLFIVIIPLVIKLYFDRKILLNNINRIQMILSNTANGIYGNNVILRNIKNYIQNLFAHFYNKYIKNKELELSILLISCVYLVMFFGYFRFFNPAYGHTDEETHLFWIYSITENNAFPTGIYPHGMHFLIATLSTLFKLNLDYVTLSFSVLLMLLLLLSIYLLMRTIFKSRYIALFSWIIILLTSHFSVSAYYRLQYIFPMEFAFISSIIAIYALIETIKNKDNLSFVLFSMSIIWGIYAHFYGTIVTAVICVIFGIIFFVKIFKEKLLKKYIIIGLVSVFIGLLPYIIGLGIGYEFERSISWALGVMSGDEDRIFEGLTYADVLTAQAEEDKKEEAGFELEFSDNIVASVFDSKEIAVVAGIIVLSSFILITILAIINKKNRIQFLIYLFLIGIWVLFMLVAMSDYLPIPAILHPNRAGVVVFLMSSIIFAIPLQIIESTISKFILDRKFTNVIIVILGIATVYSILYFQEEKEDLIYDNIVSYADSKTVQDLITTQKDNTWTVVTTTNMLAMIRGNGYHVEIIDALKFTEDGEDLYIPTEDIYIVVEKRAMIFAQKLIDENLSVNSEWFIPISKELALSSSIEDIISVYGASPDRAYFHNRDVIMSKLEYWVEKLKINYPDQISIYYEDEFATVYNIKQDPYFLLNLSINYMDNNN